MPAVILKDIEDLPAILRMKDVQNFLGLSRPKTYELAHTKGFPVVKFGRAIRVPKSAFLRWLDSQARRQEEL
jgi:excisionase family DNA binding protein